ncbi:MAG: polysaccharide deacetylase family protein [Gammaproteobacteria bacterium]|nr:polysaccharide deacetylase family protein [Gammaproteobacteria bacterium]MDG1509505.1 polysaccharide deacetylase family protein [Flavobacteriaceae bacterium]MDG2275085.1 polysaccharide deacetylase family protein [Flavobacteriaceae bacterium]|tara:strand:- start:344 stop:964 length:621 start_codon:yes stop_codon:yes gene_type:complete
MKFYTIKTPTIIQKFFSNYRWRFSSVPKEIYLTFDDGPTLEVTNFVLEELKKHQAKATFFCIGKNVKKHQNIYHKIQEEGHSVGNHTFNHLNGLLTKNTRYIENIQQASAYIVSKLFRPPYGRLKSSQARLLQQEGYKIIMWNVLSGDFDRSISPENCLENVLKNTTNGSIIVMHDSEKAKDKIYFALPRILDHFSQKGYLFKAII